MPVGVPQLSSQERDDRERSLKKNIAYPISSQWALTLNNTNLATSDLSTLGAYTSNVIQLPYNFSIIGMSLSNALVVDGGGAATPYFVVAASYYSVFTVAATMGIATQPDESGNVFYRRAITDVVYNDTFWIKNGPDPDGLFVPANTAIYIHLWASSALLSAANVAAQGSLMLVLEQTGIRN